MGVAYSQDLRDRVMAAVDGGLGVYGAAPLFRVSVSYISRDSHAESSAEFRKVSNA